MKRLLKGLAPMMGAILALTSCGWTDDPAPAPDAADGQTTTVDYSPGEPVLPKEDSKPIRIGVSFPLLDQFLQNVANAIQARAKEINEKAGKEVVQVTVVSADEKIEVQLNQVETFVTDKVDALIVLPQDTATTSQITQKAQAENIPLIYVNRRPKNLPDGIPYVGSDSLVSGQLEMEELAKLVDYKGNVAILEGDTSQEAAQLRTQGCKEIAAKYNMPVVFSQTGLWKREKGLELTENLLQSGEQVNVICANNDEMALGAITALENAGKLNDVAVGGVDATKDALNAMEAGKLEVTVFQDAKGQGQASVDTAITMINKDPVDDVINVPYQLVTPENMAEYRDR